MPSNQRWRAERKGADEKGKEVKRDDSEKKGSKAKKN